MAKQQTSEDIKRRWAIEDLHDAAKLAERASEKMQAVKAVKS